MTVKEKEEFLLYYRLCGKRIDRLCDEFSQWRLRNLRVFFPAASQPKNPALMDIDLQLRQIENEIQDEIQKLKALRRQTQIVIEQVPDQTLRLLLEYRYINGDTFMALSEKMNYSYMHITRLHTKALSILDIDDTVRKRAHELWNR